MIISTEHKLFGKRFNLVLKVKSGPFLVKHKIFNKEIQVVLNCKSGPFLVILITKDCGSTVKVVRFLYNCGPFL